MKKIGSLIAITCLLFAMAFRGHAQGLDNSDSSEYLIKAGYIYNFAKLIDWPAKAFPQADSPIVIGILGDDPFGKALVEIVIMGSAALAWLMLGQPIIALVFGVLAVISGVIAGRKEFR